MVIKGYLLYKSKHQEMECCLQKSEEVSNISRENYSVLSKYNKYVLFSFT